MEMGSDVKSVFSHFSAGEKAIEDGIREIIGEDKLLKINFFRLEIR